MTAVAEMPEAVQAAIERFDSACKSWGWQEDQGYDGTGIQASEAEYAAARIALIDAILADRQRDQWQPIETAPKDGTAILVCGPHYKGGNYYDVQRWPDGWGGKWPVSYMAYAAGEPTHWQPLPAAPKGGAA